MAFAIAPKGRYRAVASSTTTRALEASHDFMQPAIPETPSPRGGGILALQRMIGNRATSALLEAGAVRHAAVQRASSGRPAETTEPGSVHEAAKLGTRGPSERLPHLARIQRAFGRHDLSGVKAHTGADAARGALAMGAAAFTTGEHIAFSSPPSLRVAAHEAAHVVQQRGGVRLDHGVGARGDVYERHADAVAAKVMSGGSAEGLLDGAAARGRATPSGTVQRLTLDQLLSDSKELEAFKDRLTNPVGAEGEREVGALLHNNLPYLGKRPSSRDDFPQRVLLAHVYELPLDGGPFRARSDVLVAAAARVAEFGKALAAAMKLQRADYMKEKRHKDEQGKPFKSLTSGSSIGLAAVAPDLTKPNDKNAMTPFILRLKAKYQPDQLRPEQALELQYQFTGSYAGYLTGIREGKSAFSSMAILNSDQFQAWRDGRREDALSGFRENYEHGSGFYGNVHEPTEDESVADIVDRRNKTADSEMRRWDAMTKIAGEGARWQCVREAAEQKVLTDNLVFYTELGQEYVGIAFKDLWLTWRDFGNAYDIPNEDVKGQLKTTPFKVQPPEP